MIKQGLGLLLLLLFGIPFVILFIVVAMAYPIVAIIATALIVVLAIGSSG